jgi:ABC-type uncharacterized transport system substrate-binding protein
MRSIAAALFLWLGVSVPVFAQNAGDLPLVGYLRINSSDGNKPMAMLYRSASAAFGWVDGRNVRIEFRLAEGHPERFPELAEALVRDKASVIVASGLPAIRAAQRATSTIPIIATDDDLVAEGVVASLAKPGGNTTGLSILGTELDAKRLEILTQILPPPRRIALLRSRQQYTCAGAGGRRYGSGARRRASGRGRARPGRLGAGVRVLPRQRCRGGQCPRLDDAVQFSRRSQTA